MRIGIQRAIGRVPSYTKHGRLPVEFLFSLGRSMPSLRKFSARLLEGAILSLVLPIVVVGATEVQPARIYLHENWQVQSSCEVKASGEQISSVGFDAAGWHKTAVPATVVGVLVADKT